MQIAALLIDVLLAEPPQRLRREMVGAAGGITLLGRRRLLP